MPRASRLVFTVPWLAITATIVADCTLDPLCTEGTVGCAADACEDLLRDGDETDVDCGGSCAPCASGRVCGADRDCASSRCFEGACCDPPCVVTARRFGDAADDRATRVVHLADGTRIIAGEMAGTVDFGGGPLVSAGQADIFVAAFAPDGSHRWSRLIGAKGVDYSPRLAVAPNGHLWLGALFQSLAIDTGAGVLESSGSYGQIMVLELDENGATLQARTFSDQGTATSLINIVATSDGGLIMAGGLIRLDFGDGTVLVSTSGGTVGGRRDTFLAKLDAQMKRVWHRKIGDENNDDAFALEPTAAGDVVIGVHAETQTDFGGPPLDEPGLVLASYGSADGAHLWSHGYGGGVYGAALSIAPSGDIALIATLLGEANLGAGKLLPAGTSDAVVARLDSTGVTRWSTPIPSSVSTTALGVLADPGGGAFAAILLTGSLDLEGGVTAPLGVDALALVHLDAEGRPAWAKNEGGVFGSAKLSRLPNGHLVAIGTYSGTLGLGMLGPSAGGLDAFVAELLP